jgi:hypothetical protein
MTPKEKADELIDKVAEFSDYETMNNLIPQKELAKIVADNVLTELDIVHFSDINEQNDRMIYWQEVKKEIEAL